MKIAKVEDSDLYLKKHIFAIHSSNNITLLQRKIYNALLFNASYFQNDQKLYSIHLGDLAEFVHYNSKDFKTIKNSIKGLTKTTIEWNVIDEQSTGEIIENASPFLAGVSFKKNICTYEYGEILKQFLLCPMIYGKIYLNIQAKLNTSSGLALYENCNRYREIKATPWLNLNILGKLLGFDSEQLLYKRIKERYINKAIQDVNANTDLYIDLIEQKNGRVVEKVKFKINKNTKSLIKADEIVCDDDLGTIKLLKKYGFTYKDSLEIIKKYCIDDIIESIDYVINQQSYKDGKVKNVSGYIIKTLQNNYNENLSSKAIIVEEQKEKYRAQKIQEEIIKKQDQKYNSYLLDITNKIKIEYIGDNIVDIMGKFTEHLAWKNPILAKWAKERKDGVFVNKAIEALFNTYLRENYLPPSIRILDKEFFLLETITP